MVIQPGEYRQARYEGQSRIVKVVCSAGEFPGYWLVEDVISHSQFKLPISAFDPAPLDRTPDDGEPAGGDTERGNTPSQT